MMTEEKLLGTPDVKFVLQMFKCNYEESSAYPNFSVTKGFVFWV